MLSKKSLMMLEKLGIRSVFFLAPQGRIEAKLPRVAEAETASGYNPNALNDKLEQSRYFAMANFWRMTLHLPIIYLFHVNHFVWFEALFCFFCFWHSSLIVMENYKMGVLSLITPDPRARDLAGPEYRPNPWGDGWFLPKKWESVNLYKRMRMEYFQNFALWFMHLARFTKEQRLAGKKIEFVTHASYSELARFEAGTRVSELVHLIYCSFDCIPLVVAIMLPKPHWYSYGWLAYIAWIWSGDLRLALLQRYHRVRIWNTILKFKNREELRKKKAELIKSAVSVR